MSKSAPLPVQAAPAETGYRSGAVARMLRMPVATLRVWERRYNVSQPALTASGQRLYSAQDIQRLALIKQLTELGHAVGQLAGLTMPELHTVAATHAQALATAGSEAPARTPAAGPWRVAVVGTGLAARLRQPAVRKHLKVAIECLGPYDTLAQAQKALKRKGADALWIHAPALHEDWLAALHADAPTLSNLPCAVLYGFASEPVCQALATAGLALMREPGSDTVLVQWLNGLLPASSAAPPAWASAAPDTAPAPPRRWSDAALADFAGLSSTIACECPRHVAELLVQLSHFEAYSAECQHRSPQDATLHQHLRQLAAHSRARFEAALEFVARSEGLMLPQ